jgi:hypothetical protein
MSGGGPPCTHGELPGQCLEFDDAAAVGVRTAEVVLVDAVFGREAGGCERGFGEVAEQHRRLQRRVVERRQPEFVDQAAHALAAGTGQPRIQRLARGQAAVLAQRRVRGHRVQPRCIDLHHQRRRSRVRLLEGGGERVQRRSQQVQRAANPGLAAAVAAHVPQHGGRVRRRRVEAFAQQSPVFDAAVVDTHQFARRVGTTFATSCLTGCQRAAHGRQVAVPSVRGAGSPASGGVDGQCEGAVGGCRVVGVEQCLQPGRIGHRQPFDDAGALSAWQRAARHRAGRGRRHRGDGAASQRQHARDGEQSTPAPAGRCRGRRKPRVRAGHSAARHRHVLRPRPRGCITRARRAARPPVRAGRSRRRRRVPPAGRRRSRRATRNGAAVASAPARRGG